MKKTTNVLDCINNGISSIDAAKTYSINSQQIRAWIKKYIEQGDSALENKKKTGNAFFALHTSKNLSELDRLKLENLKLKIENER